MAINTKVLDRGERQLFLNSTQIAGLQSYSASYDLNTEFVQGLGSENGIFLPVGNNSIEASISTSVFTNQDDLIGLTGDAAFNGYLLTSRNDISNNFCFTSGYLNTYKSSCSVGDVPKIDVDITAFGDAGTFSQSYIDGNSKVSSDISVINTGYFTGSLVTVGFGGIEVSGSLWGTDAIQSYTLDIQVNRNPVYKVGRKYPCEVKLNPPVLFGFQVSMYAKDYNPRNTTDYPVTQPLEDISVIVKDFNTKATVLNYNLPQMMLIREEYSINKDGYSVVSLTYKK